MAPFEVPTDTLAGAKKDALGKLAPLAGHTELLRTLWEQHDIDREIESGNTPQLHEVPPALAAFLASLGVVSIADLNQRDFLAAWLEKMSVAELRSAAKDLGVKGAGAKAELIQRLCESAAPEKLHRGTSAVIITNRFDALLQALGGLYAAQIQKQIDRWHPLHIEAVWDNAVNDNDGEAPDSVTERLRKMLDSQYWVPRFNDPWNALKSDTV